MTKEYQDYREQKGTDDQTHDPRDLQWICETCGTNVRNESSGYIYSHGRVRRCAKCMAEAM